MPLRFSDGDATTAEVFAFTDATDPTDPTAGVTTTVDGFMVGLAKRSFEVA